MTVRAVLFDLDGTLLDTLDDLADSMNAALVGLGAPTHPVDAYRFFVGDGVVTLARRALPCERGDEDTVARCVAAMQAEYAQRWDQKTRPYDGVLAMLSELERRGLVRAVLSNKPDACTKQCVSGLLPGLSFAAVEGAQESVPIKPDPAGALRVAEAVDVPPAAFAYLGDSSTDMQTALAAGMTPLGAGWGFRPHQELLFNGAVRVLDRPADLLAWLDEQSSPGL